MLPYTGLGIVDKKWKRLTWFLPTLSLKSNGESNKEKRPVNKQELHMLVSVMKLIGTAAVSSGGEALMECRGRQVEVTSGGKTTY